MNNTTTKEAPAVRPYGIQSGKPCPDSVLTIDGYRWLVPTFALAFYAEQVGSGSITPAEAADELAEDIVSYDEDFVSYDDLGRLEEVVAYFGEIGWTP